MDILSRRTSAPELVLRASANVGSNEPPSVVHLYSLEYLYITLKVLMKDGHASNNIARVIGHYGKTNHKSTLQALVYVLSKYHERITCDFGIKTISLLSMLTEIKESLDREEINRLRTGMKEKLELQMQAKIKLKRRLVLEQKLAKLISKIKVPCDISSEIPDWETLSNTIERDIRDTCIDAFVQEILGYFDGNVRISRNEIFRLYMQMSNLYNSLFGRIDLKREAHAYICRCIEELKMNQRYEPLRPFASTMIQLIIGKPASKTYVLCPVGRNESLMTCLCAVRDFINIFDLSPHNPAIECEKSGNFDTEINYLIDAIVWHTIPTMVPIPTDLSLEGILRSLNAYCYDLRYVCSVLNNIKRDTQPMRVDNAMKTIKIWAISRLMSNLEGMTRICSEPCLDQAKMFVEKYTQTFNEPPPFEDLGFQLRELQASIVAQHMLADKICHAVTQKEKLYSSDFFKGKQNELMAFNANFSNFLTFGGLPDVPNMSRKEAMRRKLIRTCACKKYSEYVARYRYSWNVSDFCVKFSYPLMINNKNVEDDYDAYLKKGVNDGVWDINHQMRLCDLFHQIKYNSRLANFVQKLLPPGIPLIKDDPTLRMFDLSESA